MLSGGSLPTFWRNVLSQSSGFKSKGSKKQVLLHICFLLAYCSAMEVEGTQSSEAYTDFCRTQDAAFFLSEVSSSSSSAYDGSQNYLNQRSH
jgi:hypothetical protein